MIVSVPDHYLSFYFVDGLLRHLHRPFRGIIFYEELTRVISQ